MRKGLCMILIIILAVSMLACAPVTASETTGQNTTQTQPQMQATEQTTLSTAPTGPLHTELYVVGVSTKRMVRYFNEIALSMEYAENVADANKIHKWNEKILYSIKGKATDEDITVLNKLFDQLNDIEGFPGISVAKKGQEANLEIGFYTPADFKKEFSAAVKGEDAYGAAQYWYYDHNHEIHKGRIGYRTDVSQDERNSILLEEIINILGLSDSELRSDSIVYQHSNEKKTLSQVDWAILKLLYNPKIQSGMNAADCEPILEELYY